MWNCKKITIRAGLREWETYGTLTRSRTLSLSTVCFNRSIFRWYLSTWLTSHSVSLSHLFGLQYMFLARLPHSRHLKHGISTEETVSAFIPYHEYQETIQRLIGYESSHMTKPKDYAFWFTVLFSKMTSINMWSKTKPESTRIEYGGLRDITTVKNNA